MTDPLRLPESLARLCSSLSEVQISYIASLRDKILQFDENLIEQEFTTRTLYGTKKSNNTVLKKESCAEFIPVLRGVHRPRLRLQLPYPKKRFGAPGNTYHNTPVKGLAWVETRHKNEWDSSSPLRLLFYLTKGQRYSYMKPLDEYSVMCRKLTGKNVTLTKIEDLVQLSLQEWKAVHLKQ